MPEHKQHLEVFASPYGDPKDVRLYKKGRKCKLCKKKLNVYTPGPYCLSHEFTGACLELEKTRLKHEKEQAAYRRMMRRRAKEKRRLREERLREQRLRKDKKT